MGRRLAVLMALDEDAATVCVKHRLSSAGLETVAITARAPRLGIWLAFALPLAPGILRLEHRDLMVGPLSGTGRLALTYLNHPYFIFHFVNAYDCFSLCFPCSFPSSTTCTANTTWFMAKTGASRPYVWDFAERHCRKRKNIIDLDARS